MLAPGDVSEGVMMGREGYLFLADGGHRVLDYATGRATVPERSFTNFQSNIESRLRAANAVSAKFFHVIVPDKQSALTRFLPVTTGECLGKQYLAKCDVKNFVLYPCEMLEHFTPAAFLKTDTHLTNAASIALATTIAEQLTGEQLQPGRSWLHAGLHAITGYSGDLGKKLGTEYFETAEFYRGSWPNRWIHNNYIDGNNGIVDLRFNLQPRFERRLVLFGDSFGRDLAWFLSYFFAEVIFMRTPYFHVDMVNQMQPDYVITENAERYLDFCTADEERPNFFMFPHLAGKPYTPSREFAEALSAALSFPRRPYWRFRELLRGGS